MKLEERIEKIKEFETEIYETLLKTFKTSLTYDTRIKRIGAMFGVMAETPKKEQDEGEIIDRYYQRIKNITDKQIIDKDFDPQSIESATVTYMRCLVDLIAQIERARAVVVKSNKYQNPIDYVSAVKEQNEKTYSEISAFVGYVASVHELSKDKFVQEKLESLLNYFELIVGKLPLLDDEKLKAAYDEYTARKESEEKEALEKKLLEQLAREQRLEDERFVRSVNDRFNEIVSVKTKLSTIGTGRVEELSTLAGSFIEELEQVYGPFPLSLESVDLARVMAAKEDVENAKMYINKSVSELVERYKNAEGNFSEDLKERPNSSIRGMFEEFIKKVDDLIKKYGAIDYKDDYTAEEIEMIARAYATTELISSYQDTIRESNHFIYG